MTIALTGDKNVMSLLPPEDARLVLLALFSEDGDLPEMTPLAKMAYTSISKDCLATKAKPATGKAKSKEHATQQIPFTDAYPAIDPGAAGSHSEAESAAGLQERRFDEFWEAYPRKVGKEAARKAWRRIKPTADHFEKILSVVEKAKNSRQWQKDNGQYIPNPSTWLNQGRWDDEIQLGAGWHNKKLSNMGNFTQREYDPEDLEKLVTNIFGGDG